MASAHTLPIALDRCFRNGFFEVDDPGASQTLTPQNKGLSIYRIDTATAESRALPSAPRYGIGTHVRVILQTDGGNLTITGADASVVLDTAGDFADFYVTVTKVGSTVTHVWRRGVNTTLVEAATNTTTKTRDIPINAGLSSGPWLANDRAALAATVATGDMALIVGTHGTSNPLLRAGTVAHTTNTLDYAALSHFVVPEDYVAGEDITLTIALTETTPVSDPDLEVNAYNRDAPTTDIVSANGDQAVTGSASYTVTIDGTNLVPGDTVDFRVNLELTDSGTADPTYDITRVSISYTGYDLSS